MKRITLLLLATVCCNLALALEAPEAESRPERLPEEIVVTGQKMFNQLYEQIYEAEDLMYGMFNELNDDDQYDIHCQWERRTGTRVKQRVCRPEFWDSATEAQARTVVTGMPSQPVMAVETFHYPKLEQKMREILTEHPEFLDAVVHHYELQEQLRLRKERHFVK